MRFYADMTQAQIAAEIGVSQMHVSRMLTRTLTQLRDEMLTDTTTAERKGRPTLRAREAEVLSHREQPHELDGDIITPARSRAITIRPDTLTIYAPVRAAAPAPTDAP
jgi:hypothetical protein